MTQKEIVTEVLKKLGGRAHLNDIYILGKAYIGDSSSAKSVEANIRRELNSNPGVFCHVSGMPDGWWQLCSYKNELAELQDRVKVLGDKLEQRKSVLTDKEILSKLLDTVEEMDIEVIKAHELSLNRLNREIEDIDGSGGTPPDLSNYYTKQQTNNVIAEAISGIEGITDTNTTYQLTKNNTTITLHGSDGTTMSVTDIGT